MRQHNSMLITHFCAFNQQTSAGSSFPDLQYEITHQNDTGGNQSVALNCSTHQCSYHYGVNEATSSTYRVSIRATNVVGPSPSKECSAQPIGMSVELFSFLLESLSLLVYCKNNIARKSMYKNYVFMWS